jgi:hypothetical protein
MCTRKVAVTIPLRAAEQRSHAGGSRRGLSEDSRLYREAEFRSRPAWRAAQEGVGEPGAAFFWLLFLAVQEK